MPPNAPAGFPASDPEFIAFPSRRSVVHSANGMVCCTQPLAAQAGQIILQAGGNAADAAVAVAAALNMTEPASTGIGGDMFCLFYDAKTKQVKSINGSGRSPGNTSLDQFRDDLAKQEKAGRDPLTSVFMVTVPGAAAGWIDTVESLGSGKISMEEILKPAVELGENGFPVSEISAVLWRECEQLIKNASPNFGEILKSDGKSPDCKRAPQEGEIMKNPTLANTFRLLAEHGKAGFYQGPVADAIEGIVKDLGGHLTLEDLKYHGEVGSEPTVPISLTFNGQGVRDVKAQEVDAKPGKAETSHGVKMWEHPPNGQGIVALIALGILEELEKSKQIPTFSEQDHNSAEYLHALIEALQIAFADATWFVTDPEIVKVPVSGLISQEYLAERAKLFNPKRASNQLHHGSPAFRQSDTVYLATTDKEGNGCSFINSVYTHFGTGIVPKGCGFSLQSRGANFSLETDHPNAFAPRKRPYHTIVPAMVTNADDNSLHSVYGVMGGFMQPQGHVQVLLNMLVFKYSPQAALDAPRICIGSGLPDQGSVLDKVFVEEGISEDVAEQLRNLGHDVSIVKGFGRSQFGRGQVIRCHTEDGQKVYSAGSDLRGDGAAFPV